MADEAKAMATMIANIEKQTGKTLAQLAAVVTKSKLTKHTELRTMLMEQFGLGHGQANAVVHLALKSDGASAAAAGGPAAGAGRRAAHRRASRGAAATTTAAMASATPATRANPGAAPVVGASRSSSSAPPSWPAIDSRAKTSTPSVRTAQAAVAMKATPMAPPR